MSVSRLFQKLSYANHESLIKQSVVSRETKEYRRALQLLANPTTAYHATSPDPLPDILSSGELKPGWRGAYGKGVYFGIGAPAGDYYPTNGAMFATTNPLKNTVPLIPRTAGIDTPGVQTQENRRYYWTNTPDAVPISNNKTTFILPAKGDYSDSVRANKLRSIPRDAFRRAFEATHPNFSDSVFYHQASENPAGTNRVIGNRVFDSLKDAEAIAKSMGGRPPTTLSETLAPLLGDVTAAKPSVPTQTLLDAAGSTGPTQALLGEVPAAKPSAPTQALLGEVPAAKPSAPTQALLEAAGAADKPSAPTQALLGEVPAAKPSAPASVLENMKWYRSRNLLGGALAGTAIGGAGLAAHLINRKKRNAYAANQLAG